MNENYQVLARKYRPQTFKEVIGQDVLVQTLTNSIQQNKIHHAFVLTGIRGVGKTTTARLIAKSLNCIGVDGIGKETISPCLQCEHCRNIASSIDQDVIEIDAASNNGVGDIRDIIETINYMPVSSRYKIYIIDEFHMLSNSAFNALLKTLEEPPRHVKFIFATTEIKKVPITILSRCIRFDLKRIDQKLLADSLINISQKEGYELNSNSANLISFASEGSFRDSLSILDRIISFNNFEKNISEDKVLNILGLSFKNNIYELYGSILKGENNRVIELFNQIYLSMVSPESFLDDLLDITHKLIMKKNKNELNNLSSFEIDWLEKNYNNVNLSALFRIWQFLIKSIYDIKNMHNYKNFLEILLLKIIYGVNIPEIEDIIKKLQNNLNNVNINTRDEKNNLIDKVLTKFDGAKIV